MKTTKAQEEINEAEWGNSSNWSTIYFSKKDSRTCVPKRNLKHGWTINFGSRDGSRWIYYFFLFFMMRGGVFGAIIAVLIMKIP